MTPYGTRPALSGWAWVWWARRMWEQGVWWW